jgi:Lrp/AsnC family leucine-responsive transcriptional regulator
MHSPKKLDDLDIRILKSLQTNARMTFSELGRTVGLSSPAAAERVKKLEDGGYIKGYKAILNPEKIGVTITAIISMSSQTSVINVRDQDILNLPEVVEIYHTSGKDSVQIKVMTDSIGHLKTILDTLNKHSETTTSIILSSPVESRPIPVQIV